MASASQTMLAGVFAAVALATVEVEAHAQAPTDLPALPEAPGAVTAPNSPPPMLAPAGAPATTCTPGHCKHRTALGRKRCKRHLQEAFIGFPEEFERPPLGAALYAANNVQVVNGQAAAMVLHQFDFEPDGARLNLRGQDKLGAIAAKLPSSFHAVVVERSGIAKLDEQRRAAILTALNSGPFPVPPQRVVVGPAIARGMSGDEAALIHEVMLLRTAQGGPPVGIGTAPSSGASTR